MKILVTGASGLVGSMLTPALQQKNHTIKRLAHQEGLGPDPASLEGIEAVVHLAGETIAERWTEKKKQRISDSRVGGTRALVDSLLKMKVPPKVFISASAVGYYGNHDTEMMREDSPAGQDFLASVCKEWEMAAQPLAQKGIRTVHLRFGIILSPKGGALGKMLLPFKMGVGGKIASGRQYMSWVDIEDVVGIIEWTLMHENLQGPVNAVAPHPVKNEEFTKTLGKVLHRPTLFPMPAPVVHLIFGEMGDALLSGGVRVEPKKIIQSGYSFRYAELEGSLRHLLG